MLLDTDATLLTSHSEKQVDEEGREAPLCSQRGARRRSQGVGRPAGGCDFGPSTDMKGSRSVAGSASWKIEASRCRPASWHDKARLSQLHEQRTRSAKGTIGNGRRYYAVRPPWRHRITIRPPLRDRSCSRLVRSIRRWRFASGAAQTQASQKLLHQKWSSCRQKLLFGAVQGHPAGDFSACTYSDHGSRSQKRERRVSPRPRSGWHE